MVVNMSSDYTYSFHTQKSENLALSVYKVGFKQCTKNCRNFNILNDYYLIHHVVKGKGFLSINSTIYSLKEGDCFIIYPFQEFSYWADNNDPWDYYWVGFNGSDAPILLDKTDFSQNSPIIYSNFRGELKNAILNIYNSRGDNPFNRINMTGYLYIMLALIAYKSSPATSTSSHHKFAQKSISFISQNYKSQITINDISKFAGISRSQLYRIFMEIYHVPPVKFLSNYRVNMACELIKNTNMPINTIATSVGFSDGMYFSKTFKKLKGTTPKEYRFLANKTTDNDINIDAE